MRRGALAAFVLILFIVAAFAPAAFAAQALLDDAQAAEAAVGESPEPDVSAEPTPSEDPIPTPAVEEPSPEPSAEPSQTQSGEPGPTSEPTPEPTPSSTPAAPPVLEILGTNTIGLNEETPAIRLSWPAGMLSGVGGYVWSVGRSGNQLQVFYVSYSPDATTLAAGALNGHIRTAGDYIVQCQPVDAEQQAVTEPAAATLHVEDASYRLRIIPNKSFPVVTGTSARLTADVGEAASLVKRYEWKPSAGSSGAVCTIGSVAAGPVRYSCTAVLENGMRVTSTIVVTGTSLTAASSDVSFTAGTGRELSTGWSNGSPGPGHSYRWSAPNDPEYDLSGYSGSALPASALRRLKARANPYMITCQAYEGSAPVGQPVSFRVRALAAGTLASAGSTAEAVRSEIRTATGDANGRVPDTQDVTSPREYVFSAFAAGITLGFCLLMYLRKRRSIR